MATFGWETTAQDVLKEYGSNIKGKTILITGASASGLGAQTALALATAEPAQLILQGRSESKIQPVIDEIKHINPEVKVSYAGIDLASIEDVRRGAAELNKSVDHIDILINNAGIMAVKEYTKSADGIESQFATNHIGHFLLTNLILNKIVKAGKGARIVNLTSDGHRLGHFRGDDYNFEDGKDYHAWSGYGQSKTANILFTHYLADALAPKGIYAFSVHPGVIWGTGLGGHLELADMQPETLDKISIKNTGRKFRTDDVDGGDDFKDFKSKDQGIATTLVAALDPRIEKDSGSYLDNGRVVPERPYAKDPATIEKLWTVSEGLVGEKFDLKTL